MEESSCNTSHECCIEDKLTHIEIRNRPGLSSISYRIATHGRFKEIMLSMLDLWILRLLQQEKKKSKNERIEGEEPAGTSRNHNNNDDSVTIGLVHSDDDLTTALIDCWAVIADIITFYQERIANEGFLRTARERRSIIEIGRMTGYELRPGVAASTFLAFNLEEAPGIAEVAFIDVGIKVQSLPGPNEKAQIFETIEKIEARREWNSLKPRTTRHRRKPSSQDYEFVLAETNSKLKTGDLLLLVSRLNEARGGGGTFETHFRKIDKIETDLQSQLTTIYTHDPLNPPSSDTPSQLSPENRSLDEIISQIQLEGKPIWLTHMSESQLEKHGADLKWEKGKLEGFLNSILSKEIDPNDYEGLYMFNTKCSVFGHNAPKYRVIPQPPQSSGSQGYIPTIRVAGALFGSGTSPQNDLWDKYNSKDISINENSEGQHYDNNKNKIFLDNTYPGIILRSFVVLQKPDSIRAYEVEAVEEKTLADFSITGKSTGITIRQVNLSQEVDELAQFKLRETTVYATSKKLDLAPDKKDSEMEKNNIELDRIVTGFRIGQYVAITGKTLTTVQGRRRPDMTGSIENEVAEISDISHINGYTVLRFKEDLKNRYRRDTVTINANLAKATHGETRVEILGAGDPSKKFQEFAIKQKPLTYISGMSDTGTISSLEIRINDILWKEIPNLLQAGPSDHVYLVRTDDDKTVRVIFGDGLRGARPRAGIENIKAQFRVGIGKEGLLRHGQLSLLMTRPLGVRSVTNPIPTTGADNPESLEKSRRNASLNLLAMGRIVSLKDVEDFARAFAGIGKAQAIWVWNGEKRVVHLTIAPVTGLKIDESTDLLYKNLIKAIKKSIDPGISVSVHSFNPRFFNVEARVRVLREFLGEKVLEEIRSALVEGFSFESRELGQPIRIDEVVKTIQKIDGVESADIDKLYDSVGDALLQKHIESYNTKWKDGKIVPAECLVINSAFGGIVLREVRY